MNIALISTGMMGKEATAITINSLANELKKTNNITIISEQRNEKFRKSTVNGITYYRVGWSKHFNIYNRILGHGLGVKKMQKTSKNNFDIIHSFSSAAILVLRGFFAKLFAKKSKLIHTMKSYSRSKLGRSFYFLLNLADIVTVPTKVFADKLIKGGVKRSKIRIINSHIDTTKFIPMDKDKLKQKYHYKGKKVIFYYGAMWEVKGTDILLKAMPKIVEMNKDVIFVFAPRNLDWRIDKYKKEIADMNLTKYSDFVLNAIKINEYVAMADTVVLPYPNLIGTEGNPSCLLEAMSTKTPVVTTKIPELTEILTPGKDVIMAKPSDAISLANEINNLLANKKLQKQIAQNAYAKSKKFDIKLISKKFMALYKELKGN